MIRSRSSRWEYESLSRLERRDNDSFGASISGLSRCKFQHFSAEEVAASGLTSVGLLAVKHPVVCEVLCEGGSFPNMGNEVRRLIEILPAESSYTAGWFAGDAGVLSRSAAFDRSPCRWMLREGSDWDWVVWIGTLEQVLRASRSQTGSFQAPHFLAGTTGLWTLLVGPGMGSALLGCSEDLRGSLHPRIGTIQLHQVR